MCFHINILCIKHRVTPGCYYNGVWNPIGAIMDINKERCLQVECCWANGSSGRETYGKLVTVGDECGVSCTYRYIWKVRYTHFHMRFVRCELQIWNIFSFRMGATFFRYYSSTSYIRPRWNPMGTICEVSWSALWLDRDQSLPKTIIKLEHCYLLVPLWAICQIAFWNPLKGPCDILDIS